MKIKFKLSLIVIILIAVVVAGIASLSLFEAANISLDLSLRSARYLAQAQAEYWKGREDGYIRMARTLAEIMADYEDMPEETRRDRFDSMLHGTIEAEPMLINLYTVWKPNAVDGMDADYTDRIGSTPTGQYAIAYTRETGTVTARTTTDVAASMAYFNGPDSKRDRVEQPFFRNVNGQESYLTRMMVPIINPRTNETVGGVGLLLDISAIEIGVQDVIENYNDIAALTVYSSNGFILGHLRPDRVGKMLTDVETIFGDYLDEASAAVAEGREFECNTYSPVLETDVEVIMYPFTIGNSDMTWTVMITLAQSTIMAPGRRLSPIWPCIIRPNQL